MQNIVVLISGRGSNLRAILEAIDVGLPLRIAGVISDKPTAAGIELAHRYGIASRVVDHGAYPPDERAGFHDALASAIDEFDPALIVLAGFMRILSAAFVARYKGRMMNIHPSLLPAFPGLHTHRRALEAGVKFHGCTVHFVSETLDSGPIIVQAVVTVRDDDTEASLACRVLEQEHRIYPLALRLFAENRLRITGNRVRVAVDEAATPGPLTSPKLTT
ncbi:MAG: phosphoribosylglycinamide formyltransferase [Burkholderiales bacterium]|nr:phosphoribosylglycinamide formyltransferase [Burkholderiales bacterium]